MLHQQPRAAVQRGPGAGRGVPSLMHGRAAWRPLPHAPSPPSRHTTLAAAFRQAGPTDPPPSHADIDAQPLNRVVMSLFRRKMADAVGQDSKLQGYDAVIDLTRTINSMHASPQQTQDRVRTILLSLFPSWLPGAFKVMFSGPLPALSCRLNAWATALTCQWLMGPSRVNDIELPGGQVGQGMGVLVERCRYLEATGCASVCMNSCKVPTQEFFARDMGLPLTMTPNYDDFSCQFAFGQTPPPIQQDEAFLTPCFVQCPSKKAARHAAAAGQPAPPVPGCGGIEV